MDAGRPPIFRFSEAAAPLKSVCAAAHPFCHSAVVGHVRVRGPADWGMIRVCAARAAGHSRDRQDDAPADLGGDVASCLLRALRDDKVADRVIPIGGRSTSRTRRLRIKSPRC